MAEDVLLFFFFQSAVVLSISAASKSFVKKTWNSLRSLGCTLNASISAMQMSLSIFERLNVTECKVSLCASVGLCTLCIANPSVCQVSTATTYQKPTNATAITH